jgi:hypothetical protein
MPFNPLVAMPFLFKSRRGLSFSGSTLGTTRGASPITDAERTRREGRVAADREGGVKAVVVEATANVRATVRVAVVVFMIALG